MATTVQNKSVTGSASENLFETHSSMLGYLTWIFGFMGAHRFYFGKKLTGTLWFFTFGLLCVGWVVDFFLIPAMKREANRKYVPGPADYSAGWLLLTFLGYFGIHRLYLQKYVTGILWMLTGGLLGLGWLYDLWTLNDQIDEFNRFH